MAFKASRKKEEFPELDPAKIPVHVAIIMDGNGRWAKKRFLPRSAGHRKGITSVHEVVAAASDIGVKVMTLYAFSTENWKRPVTEVKTLMDILVEFLKIELKFMMKNNVRFRTIGQVEALPEAVRRELQNAKEQTADNTGLILNIALNYSGRSELVIGVKEIAEKVKKGELSADNITEATVSDHLYTREFPDPDLLIRTSGEMRISNYLLWQLAYSEIVVTPVLWPDFRRKEFFETIKEFQQRDRRFGAVDSSG
ncbi:MAG: isoprenyl transferase [bacterium]